MGAFDHKGHEGHNKHTFHGGKDLAVPILAFPSCLSFVLFVSFVVEDLRGALRVAASPQGSALPDIAVERVVHLPIAVSEPVVAPPLVLVRKAEPPGDVLPEIQNRLGVLFVRRVQLGRLVRGRGRR